MNEFVELRSKLYAFKNYGGTINRKKDFNHQLDCLNDYQTLFKNQKLIRYKSHEAEAVHQKKIALSENDDK